MKIIDDIIAELAPDHSTRLDKSQPPTPRSFKDLSPAQRLSRADERDGTWQTYFGAPNVIAFKEQEANQYARSVGGEIDWTVVALDEFVQRSIGEGKTWDQIRQFAETCIAAYQKEWERHDF